MINISNKISNASKKSPLKFWETKNDNGYEERYSRTGSTFLASNAVKSLSHPAFHILMYMHMESGGHPDFKFPYSKYKDIISKGGFQNALNELIAKGFVIIKQKNQNLRIPNVYSFSGAWRAWEDSIPP